MSRAVAVPLPFTSVHLDDVFWAPKLRVNREVTLRTAYAQCRDTGRIDAFDLAPGSNSHIFWDSDVAKWIEAAAYAVADQPDPDLAELLDEVARKVVAAQQPDGYLNSHFTVAEPEQRWTNLRDWHELYCAGHLMEAALAHFQATGRRELLDALCRYADHIRTVFGTGPGQKRGYCGHEEVELALVKLHRATGERRYLDLARYFIDERGRPDPHYFDVEAAARGEDPQALLQRHGGYARYEYNQSHLPVREQTEVVGHAVRAMYLYSAMADLAGELDDAELRAACERLWADVTQHKLYLSGGLGPSARNEGFTARYDLPNRAAYAETCAAIGMVFWAHRMLQLDLDGEYADVMETCLYNGTLSGVSLDGQRFFYTNPLATRGDHHRQEWFGCACCPPNLARLIASLGGYVASRTADGVALHLYSAGTVDAGPVRLRVDTRYPWDGAAQVTFETAGEYTLRLRVPGWCPGWSLAVNGEPADAPPRRGYLALRRTWSAGDVVQLDMAMPALLVEAHPLVEADRGMLALTRGPLVYCVEAADHDVDPWHLRVTPEAMFHARWEPELLGGVMVLEGGGEAPVEGAWDNRLYQRAGDAVLQPVRIRAIPYYAWGNREAGPMTVWLRRA